MEANADKQQEREGAGNFRRSPCSQQKRRTCLYFEGGRHKRRDLRRVATVAKAALGEEADEEGAVHTGR